MAPRKRAEDQGFGEELDGGSVDGQAQEQLGGEEEQAPRPPQGIVPRFMHSGDPRKDFHHIHRDVQAIDPASLVVDGQPPFLACPVGRNIAQVKIVQVDAKVAARMLTCDPASGGQPIYRLATDAEVAQYKKAHASQR